MEILTNQAKAEMNVYALLYTDTRTPTPERSHTHTPEIKTQFKI